MPDKAEQPNLETTPGDRAIELLKGVASFAPGIGPIIANALLNDLPGQRLDRFRDFLWRLDARLSALEAEALRDALQDPEQLDLFQEAAGQAARAVSPERRQHIVNIIAHGLTGDDKARIEAKRLLALLDDVDDDQMIILASYLHKNRGVEFRAQHSNVLEPVVASLGGGQERADAATVHELARAELVRLGLLRLRFRPPKKGEMPEFDEQTGMIKSSSRELSPLGRLLLRRAGVAEQGEF